MDYTYAYEKNIFLIEKFYESDFYSTLSEMTGNNHQVVKSVINCFYEDPDIKDKDSIISKELIDKFPDIKLGLDGLCGWKILFDIHEGNPEWIDDYRTIRGSKYGYLVWPSDTGKRSYPTINQQRYLVFGDRIDYTLFDIKLYYDGKREQCRLKKAYNGSTIQFLNELKSFKNFLDFMNLQIFVDKGEVINLDKLDDRINESHHEKFRFSCRWSNKTKKEEFGSYIKNIVDICKTSQLP